MLLPVGMGGWLHALRIRETVLIAGALGQPQSASEGKTGKGCQTCHDDFFSYLGNPCFCKNSWKLSSHVLNAQETVFYLYLPRDTTAPLPGRRKSSWYNLDWFAFKSFVMTERLMPWCRSLTTGLMHLTNNLTVEFISVAFPFTVKCTYSPAAVLFLQDAQQAWWG